MRWLLRGILPLALSGCVATLGAPYKVRSESPEQVVIDFDPAAIKSLTPRHIADNMCRKYDKGALIQDSNIAPPGVIRISFSCVQDIEQETNTARAALKHCAINNVDTVDDRISDATTIAVSLAAKCDRERDLYLLAFSKKLPGPQERNIFLSSEQTQVKKIDEFLPYVLQHRSLLLRGAPIPARMPRAPQKDMSF